ncbi:hypothetical protein M514_22612, partial [Trichuris suis]
DKFYEQVTELHSLFAPQCDRLSSVTTRRSLLNRTIDLLVDAYAAMHTKWNDRFDMKPPDQVAVLLKTNRLKDDDDDDVKNNSLKSIK